jgi:hypothetical protein
MQITDEMIRAKAYELWEAEGKPEGNAEKNWFAAKTLLLQKNTNLFGTGKSQIPPIGLRQLRYS